MRLSMRFFKQVCCSLETVGEVAVELFGNLCGRWKSIGTVGGMVRLPNMIAGVNK
jgi:hypothetical protein